MFGVETIYLIPDLRKSWGCIPLSKWLITPVMVSRLPLWCGSGWEGECICSMGNIYIYNSWCIQTSGTEVLYGTMYAVVCIYIYVYVCTYIKNIYIYVYNYIYIYVYIL